MIRRTAPAGRSTLLPAVLLLVALLPRPARAQWTVEASAGRAVYDPVSARIDAVNGSLGARYDDASGRWLYLAGGAALGSPGPGWGAGGLGRRFGTGRPELSLEVGAHFYGYSASEYDTDGVELREPPGGGITLEAVPTLALRRGIFDLEVRAGVVESVIFVSDLSNALTALDGGAVLTAAPAPGVQVSGIGRYLLLPEGGYPYLGASAQLTRGPAAAWAFGGRWITDLLESPRSAYGAGGSLSLGRGTTVTGTWQQEPGDPIYASTPRSTWSLRVSRAFGRRPAAPAAAAPAPGPPVAAADG
ncbi:MAG TPA: hypothetical protein VF263_24875, partial [Longimicrobiaceae bacterium]